MKGEYLERLKLFTKQVAFHLHRIWQKYGRYIEMVSLLMGAIFLPGIILFVLALLWGI